MADKPTFEKGMPRRDHGPPSRDLQTHTEGISAKPLPLIHSTTVYGAREIAKGGRLKTKACDVFQKDLVYFFVMRPAYRSRFAGEKQKRLSAFPVVFILPPDHMPVPHHVFPFDTGAAAKGAFHDLQDPQIPLEDYELVPTLEAAASHIGWSFEGVETYLEGDIRQDIEDQIEDHDIVTHGYIDVARMGRRLHNKFDRRASTVEVAFAEDVILQGRKGLVILPVQLLNDTSLIDAFTKSDLTIEAYPWQANTLPDDYEKDIAELAKDWYRKNGWLQS